MIMPTVPTKASAQYGVGFLKFDPDRVAVYLVDRDVL